MRKRGVVLLALVCASVLSRGTSAWACSCLPSSTKDRFQAAGIVFTGTVALVDRPQGNIEVTFAVRDVFKGDVPETLVVSTAPSGAECGIDFVAGKRYDVFTSIPRTGRADVGVCSGTDAAGTLARAGILKPIRSYDELSALGEVIPRASDNNDDGARAGAIGAAGLLLLFAGAFFAWRARSRKGAGGTTGTDG